MKFSLVLMGIQITKRSSGHLTLAISSVSGIDHAKGIEETVSLQNLTQPCFRHPNLPVITAFLGALPSNVPAEKLLC